MSICTAVSAFLAGAKEAHYEHLCEKGRLPLSVLNRQSEAVDRYWRHGTYGEHMGATLGNMIKPAYILFEGKKALDDFLYM